MEKQGVLHFELDYPEKKSNFFMYAVLPKKMVLVFNSEGTLSTIEKVGVINQFSVCSKAKNVGMFFKYGTEEDYCSLNSEDVMEMKKDFPKYSIELSKKKDTIAGFNALQAFAVNSKNKKDRIELWYTTEIVAPNANYPTPFENIPGVLLSYEMSRYGIRTTIKATRFETKEIKNTEVLCKVKGKKRSFLEYNNNMMKLFQSFEE